MAPKGHKAILGLPVRMERQALRDRRVSKGCREPMVRTERMARRASKASPETLGRPVPKAQRGHRGFRAYRASKVCKVRQGLAAE